MQFVCLHQALLKGISTVERAVSARDVMPVLKGILLEAQDSHLRLVATDLELGVECIVPAQVATTGRMVLDGKVFTQIVRKLDGDQVSFSLSEASMVSIEGGQARYNLHALPHEEFPDLPGVGGRTLSRMPQKELKRMIRETIFATASEESRPALTGALFEVTDDEVRMIATDISRLAYRSYRFPSKEAETDDSQGTPLQSAIVPARTMQELMRLLSTDDESIVEFVIADNQVVFRLPSVTIVSSLIEGSFPDYRRAFPGEQPTRMRLSRSTFLAAVERAALIARHSMPPIVTLTATEEYLAISSREPDVGEVYEELPTTLEGVPATASYQAYFLTEVLRALDADEVIVELGQGLKQGSIRVVNDDDFLYILMPVRVG
ncbi:MAG: DNA polymerase III subunit beta [Firmicutes bacterium]|jgi:DNA polymerase-3 subunit beta|nr:DNA polymerase III subunit beta [Bacillota bacterium]